MTNVFVKFHQETNSQTCCCARCQVRYMYIKIRKYVFHRLLTAIQTVTNTQISKQYSYMYYRILANFRRVTFEEYVNEVRCLCSLRVTNSKVMYGARMRTRKIIYMRLRCCLRYVINSK